MLSVMGMGMEQQQVRVQVEVEVRVWFQFEICVEVQAQAQIRQLVSAQTVQELSISLQTPMVEKMRRTRAPV